jgi:hypothetical protein
LDDFFIIPRFNAAISPVLSIFSFAYPCFFITATISSIKLKISGIFFSLFISFARQNFGGLKSD